MAAASSRLESLVGPKQDTLNQAWKEDKSGFGFKMLMKMGWSEGRGLGKELQGAATHVTVAKKTDSAGLGAEKDDTGNLRWTEASANFDSVLSRLNAAYGGDAAAAAAAKKAERRRKKKEKKEKERGEQSPAAVVGKASMLLRHPKLLKSKNIRAYSAHDMQAILGIHRSSTITTATTTTTTTTTDPASSPWASLAGVGTSRSTTVVTRTDDEVVDVVVEAAEGERRRRKKDKKKKRERGEEEEEEEAAAAEEKRKERKKAKKSKEKRRIGQE